MDWLTFISSLMASTAWPIGACVIALIFRSQIKELSSKVSKLKWGEMEAQFGEKIESIQEEVKSLEDDPDYEDRPIDDKLVDLIDTHPHLAVLEGWKTLERAIENVSIKRLDTDRTAPIQKHIQALANSNILPRAMTNAIADIREVRNRAAHEMDTGVSKGAAYVLLDTIADITAYLDKAAGKN